jgi:hypothetical protein
VLFDERVTPTPPVAAGPERVTVPTDLLPPITEAGETVKEANTGAVTVRVAVLETLPKVQVIVAVFALWSGVVLTVNVPVVEPPATVTEVGTDA